MSRTKNSEWLDVVEKNLKIATLVSKPNKINNLAVAFHVEGPFDAQEALRRVNEIYGLSLLEQKADS